MFDSYYGKLNEMSLGNAHTMSFYAIAHTILILCYSPALERGRQKDEESSGASAIQQV